MNNNMDHASLVPRCMSYHLLEEMTNGFSKDRELGRGTHGKVYLGVNKDGEKIAVKVLYDMPSLDDNDQQFDKEFYNLKCLQHPNIVRFVGHCHETRRECVPYNGRMILADSTKRALCFEYMHNRSLDNCLSDESSGHDWHTRYAIIKGICDGLKYLHEELRPPIFHLDLKPSNVLLDEGMVPKLADFGLSRILGEERTRITTSSIGTIGYLPPEFINQHVISNKFDIFSLGVVIIKIMTGHEGYSKCGEMSSHRFIDLVHKTWMIRLHGKSRPMFDSYSEQVKRCIEISLSCVRADRHQRPSIGYIVSNLNETETIDHKWLNLRGIVNGTNTVIHERPNIGYVVNEQNATKTITEFLDGSPTTPESSINQGGWQTHRTEEENMEREGLNNTENLFGAVVDDNMLNKMARYMGKPKMREDRAREALILVDEDDKEGKAINYVRRLRPFFSNLDTFCLIYNATGGTLYQVANHDWSGHISTVPYPAAIGNGQWAAFRHVGSGTDFLAFVYLPWTAGSIGAVVYRGKNKYGEDQDYLLSWRSTKWPFYPNKCYCEIGSVHIFKRGWHGLEKKLVDSDCSSSAKSDGYDIQAEIGPSPADPKFTAIITCR